MSSVFNTVDMRGVKRSGKVQTFPGVGGDGVVQTGGTLATTGAVVGKVWGVSARHWCYAEVCVARLLYTIYGFIVVYFLVLLPAASGVTVVADVGGGGVVDDRAARRVLSLSTFFYIYIIFPLFRLIGSTTLSSSLIVVFVISIFRVGRGRIPTLPFDDGLSAVSSSFYEVWADALLILFSGLACAYPYTFFYIILALFSTYSAGIYHRVFFERVSSTRGGAVAVAVFVVLSAASFFGPVAFVLVRHMVLRLPTDKRMFTAVGGGFPDLYRQVAEILGVNMRTADRVLRAAELRVVYSAGVGAPSDTPEIRRLALVGDKVLDLALARRGLREKWTVEDVSNKSQLWLSNATLASVWETYLANLFPQLAMSKESRKATLVEALLGISYTANGDLDDIEDFIFSRVSPVAVARGRYT